MLNSKYFSIFFYFQIINLKNFQEVTFMWTIIQSIYRGINFFVEKES